MPPPVQSGIPRYQSPRHVPQGPEQAPAEARSAAGLAQPAGCGGAARWPARSRRPVGIDRRPGVAEVRPAHRPFLRAPSRALGVPAGLRAAGGLRRRWGPCCGRRSRRCSARPGASWRGEGACRRPAVFRGTTARARLRPSFTPDTTMATGRGARAAAGRGRSRRLPRGNTRRAPISAAPWRPRLPALHRPGPPRCHPARRFCLTSAGRLHAPSGPFLRSP